MDLQWISGLLDVFLLNFYFADRFSRFSSLLVFSMGAIWLFVLLYSTTTKLFSSKQLGVGYGLG
jgi:hypothetical protein